MLANAALLAAFAFGCRAESERRWAHRLDYGLLTLDADYGTRDEADEEQLRWTIDLHVCSGSLIDPQYMITAEHCDPRKGDTYQSGATLNSSTKDDITVLEVVEIDAPLDYAILKISWKNGGPPSNQYIAPLIATSRNDVEISEEIEKGDEVFTVGFPSDRDSWGGTYSEGRLRRYSSSRDYLSFSVPIWNGNSGGGLWRKNDKMLVSLTNQGPDGGNEEKEGSRYWNSGAAMWAVYEQSDILKEIFPNGKNRNEPNTPNPNPSPNPTPSPGPSPGPAPSPSPGPAPSPSPTPSPTPSPVPGGSGNTSGDNALYVAIESPEDQNSGYFWISTPLTVTRAAICVGAADCLNGETTTNWGVKVKDSGNRRFFKFAKKTALKPNLNVSFTAVGSNSDVISSITVLIDENANLRLLSQ